jgi:hypothetical protein
MLFEPPRYNWNIVESGAKYHTFHENIHEFLVNENPTYTMA